MGNFNNIDKTKADLNINNKNDKDLLWLIFLYKMGLFTEPIPVIKEKTEED